MQIEPHGRGDAAAARKGEGQHLGVHVHVGALAAGARAAVGDVDAHLALALAQHAQGHAVARVAGGGDHGLDEREIEVEAGGVAGAGVGGDGALAHARWVEAALAGDPFDGGLVGGDDAGEAPGLDGHVGERGALVDREPGDAGARELEHLADAAALAKVRQREQVQHDVFGAHAGAQPAGELDARALGHAHAHVAGEPGVGHVGRADAEGEAAEGARHAGVRVGAGDELAGQGDGLDHLGVADRLGAGGAALALDLAVEREAVAAGEVRLHLGEARGLLGEAELAVGRRHDAVEKGEVVAEGVDALGLGDGGVVAEGGAKERVGHGGDVLVREAHVGAGEEGVAGGHGGHAHGAGGRVDDGVRGENLLGERHRTRRRRDGGRGDFAREARAVVGEEAAGPHDVGRDGVAPASEGLARHLFAALEALEQFEVGRGEQADVLGVLPVDLLDARGERHGDAAGELGVGGGLARRAAALRAPARHRPEAAPQHRVAGDGAAAQAHQAIAREGFVVIVTSPARRQLVGRDVVEQLARRVVGEGDAALELRPQQVEIFGEVEHLAAQAQRRRRGGVAHGFESTTARQGSQATLEAKGPFLPLGALPDRYRGRRAFFF